jgi:hypothetical protein
MALRARNGTDLMADRMTSRDVEAHLKAAIEITARPDFLRGARENSEAARRLSRRLDALAYVEAAAIMAVADGHLPAALVLYESDHRMALLSLLRVIAEAAVRAEWIVDSTVSYDERTGRGVSSEFNRLLEAGAQNAELSRFALEARSLGFAVDRKFAAGERPTPAWVGRPWPTTTDLLRGHLNLEADDAMDAGVEPDLGRLFFRATSGLMHGRLDRVSEVLLEDAGLVTARIDDLVVGAAVWTAVFLYGLSVSALWTLEGVPDQEPSR